jgi:multicomponent Na+:H+ antiporter subunit G
MIILIEIVSAIMVLLGAAFVLVAAMGLWRMPDVFARLHCTSKAGTLGAVLVVLGLAVHSTDPGILLRSMLLLAFLIITGPISAHAIARAAWHRGDRPATSKIPNP